MALEERQTCATSLLLAAEYHAEIVRQIIDFNLSAKQVKELCEGDSAEVGRKMTLEKFACGG